MVAILKVRERPLLCSIVSLQERAKTLGEEGLQIPFGKVWGLIGERWHLIHGFLQRKMSTGSNIFGSPFAARSSAPTHAYCPSRMKHTSQACDIDKQHCRFSSNVHSTPPKSNAAYCVAVPTPALSVIWIRRAKLSERTFAFHSALRQILGILEVYIFSHWTNSHHSLPSSVFIKGGVSAAAPVDHQIFLIGVWNEVEVFRSVFSLDQAEIWNERHNT